MDRGRKEKGEVFKLIVIVVVIMIVGLVIWSCEWKGGKGKGAWVVDKGIFLWLMRLHTLSYLLLRNVLICLRRSVNWRAVTSPVFGTGLRLS